MKVIGAGYGRTATKSLQIALETLGYGKCYHMEELLRNPKGVKYWIDAMEGERVAWDELFQNYNSIVDFPGSIFYKELFEYYPDAKVVLGVRDPESWYKSAFDTIYSFDPGVRFKLNMAFQMIYKQKARDLIKVFQFHDKYLWGKYFSGKFDDKDYAIAKYKRHVEEVQYYIPSDRLLLHEAKDGWEPLCEFLNLKVPTEPYPRSNKGSDFAKWSKGVVVESLSQ